MQISPKGETSKPLNAIGAPQVSLELPIWAIVFPKGEGLYAKQGEFFLSPVSLHI